MNLTIAVPVKWVVTPATKQQWQQEAEKGMKAVDSELEQLKFQGRKLLAEAQKRGAEALQIVQERLQLEEQKRLEKKERLRVQLEEINRLEDGDRVVRGTVDTQIRIQVGDNWEECIAGHEIVIKDGIIIEIK